MGQLCWTGTVDIFVISQPKWLKFGLQAHLFKMFRHTKFQLSISSTFKVMNVFVLFLRISKKCFITIIRVQEIESSNFLCPLSKHLLKMCLLPGDQISATSIEKWQKYWVTETWRSREQLKIPVTVFRFSGFFAVSNRLLAISKPYFLWSFLKISSGLILTMVNCEGTLLPIGVKELWGGG